MDGRKLLLHVCCAPDATVPLEDLPGEGYDVTAYWWGKNIWPGEEERRRFEGLTRLLLLRSVPLVRETGDGTEWEELAPPLADEPEGGKRCELCFRLQLEAAARAAALREIPFLCTTLTISPHKDVQLINSIGAEMAERHGLTWVHRIFRRQEGFLRSVKISRELGLYRQSWCGCEYSLRSGGRSKRASGDNPSGLPENTLHPGVKGPGEMAGEPQG
ncbi:epoxyqueuosine reductase QueH [Aminivibrio sp.]